jgi:hypothetical protein
VNSSEAFFHGSPIYDPVALLRGDGETLIVVSVGMKASRRYMILTPAGEPAWPHEPFKSLSDVAWSLLAHGWHGVTPEPVGPHLSTTKSLARRLTGRA